MKLADILKDSNYKLSQFTIAEIEQFEQTITLKATKSGEVPYTVCLVRQKAIKLTPEEAIRQLYLQVLIDRLHYPTVPWKTVVGMRSKVVNDYLDVDEDVVWDTVKNDLRFLIVELEKIVSNL